MAEVLRYCDTTIQIVTYWEQVYSISTDYIPETRLRPDTIGVSILRLSKNILDLQHSYTYNGTVIPMFVQW
jgi:hypothetical protein